MRLILHARSWASALTFIILNAFTEIFISGSGAFHDLAWHARQTWRTGLRYAAMPFAWLWQMLFSTDNTYLAFLRSLLAHAMAQCRLCYDHMVRLALKVADYVALRTKCDHPSKGIHFNKYTFAAA